MTDADVLVVGGGLAGCVAALAAARRDSAVEVRLVVQSDAPFERSSGLIGVLGYLPERDGPVVDPMAAIGDLPADHPYRVLGEDAVRDGLALFDDATGGAYCGGHTDRNALVPTLLGHPTPAARYPAAVECGLASREAKTLLVGFGDLPEFHAPLAAERLFGSGVPFAVEGVTTRAPVVVTDEHPARRIASALEADEPIGNRDLTARESLANAVESIADDEDRVGFPAVLGFDEAAEVHAGLAAALDADVFEVPLGPPSVLGRRLEATLHAALRDAGVTIHDRGTVVAFESDGDETSGGESGGGAITRVRVEVPSLDDADTTDGRTVHDLSPRSVVLATGGPATGGIRADRDDVRESTFDCHVRHDGERPRARSDPFGDHPFSRYGLDIDEGARVLSADGRPEYSNLFAAGTIIGGHDFVAEHSVGGVSLTSGYVAGTRAVRVGD